MNPGNSLPNSFGMIVVQSPTTIQYANQTEARVRNIIWKGDWPRQLPPLAQQELVGDGADFLDERREELTAVFQHDFVRDGFPLYRFQVYDAGWQEHIKAKPDGGRPDFENFTIEQLEECKAFAYRVSGGSSA